LSASDDEAEGGAASAEAGDKMSQARSGHAWSDSELVKLYTLIRRHGSRSSLFVDQLQRTASAIYSRIGHDRTQRIRALLGQLSDDAEDGDDAEEEEQEEEEQPPSPRTKKRKLLPKSVKRAAETGSASSEKSGGNAGTPRGL
jgi:hypothetical protein